MAHQGHCHLNVKDVQVRMRHRNKRGKNTEPKFIVLHLSLFPFLISLKLNYGCEQDNNSKLDHILEYSTHTLPWTQ